MLHWERRREGWGTEVVGESYSSINLKGKCPIFHLMVHTAVVGDSQDSTKAKPAARNFI